ncbi:hypothetical protein [Phenylobacterium sp.]|jgi:hypothetical protein|uniref:hypothetical protein n=1 Tax=Phenylobacterium sp. TaxID=1871053 RepID=UPI002E2F171C|nr:hypothetical protein [Phenylobacterium sp.]HEX3363814.1 hypothetical protein [Phenylobacterium sp.]
MPKPAKLSSLSGGRVAAGLLIGVVSIAAIAGCATAGPYNPLRLAPAQLAQVHQICRSVMGIPDGLGLSADCVANLSSSAVTLSQGRAHGVALDEARRACLGKGLAAGDPGLPVCELSTVSDHGAPAADAAIARIDTAGLTPPARSYFNASFDEVRRREQMACARVGYDPINGSFAKCVASLDSALFASQHVMQ